MNLVRLILRFISSIFKTICQAFVVPSRKEYQKLESKRTGTSSSSSGITSHHRSITPPYWVKSLSTEIHADVTSTPLVSTMTLRQFLSHPDGFHLALAPAFYGYYAYFGALLAIHEMDINCTGFYKSSDKISILPVSSKATPHAEQKVLLKSISGSSAGALVATAIAFGSDPRDAVDFISSLTLGSIADPPGFLGIFRGYSVEKLITKFFQGAEFKDTVIPVAVTAFDLLTRSTKIIDRGIIGRAVRASLSFPGLFQPVLYRNLIDASSLLPKTTLLIDGMIQDPHGLLGLSVLKSEARNKRVVNMVLGGFGGPPPGPSRLPNGVNAAEVVSICIKNTPEVSPLKMQNGPKAVRAAKEAVTDILDAPMYHGKEQGHYVLPIDASMFCY